MADIPAPLDAYTTAKPNEPTWTVQGGDPLGAPLLCVWAAFARIQAGVITEGAVDGIFSKLLEAANHNRPETDHDQKELLLRATQTEEISWDMDSYRRSGAKAETSGEKLSVPERLDLHDLRVFAASRLSQMRSELAEIKERLAALGFKNELTFSQIDALFTMLTTTYNLLQPKKDWHMQVDL